MNRTFQTFIDRVTVSADEIALHAAMADATRALELNRFAYLSLSEPAGRWPPIISTYPEAWTERYFRRRYDRIDPVLLRAAAETTPFAWGGGSANSLSERQRELFDEATGFGIRSGYTVPIHDSHGHAAALTFAAGGHGPEFRIRILRHGAVLHLLAMYFHAHVRRLRSDREVLATVALTKRERECLEWAAQGKSVWETARILGLSGRTVVFHLENAKVKLGVRTKLQAVARYIEAGRPKVR